MLSQSDSLPPTDAPTSTDTDPQDLSAEALAVLSTQRDDEPETELSGAGIEYVHRSWPADPEQLSVIRHELRRWLEPLRLSGDEVDDVVLAVDEAVANAVRHAYPEDGFGEVELTLWTEGSETSADGGALCIEITDHGSWRGVDSVTADSQGGRGMLLMQHMVETVLVHFDGRGSRVLLRHRFGAPAAKRSAEQDRAPRHAR
ncbi:ATP-binding protein [Pseudonocardia xishanensis]|uniref:Histidine kinase/HSP90-like ATPase domain-containing protein n=1 Tax=Pseudonocardia xishanensis TaxID=630995 RepID=A0ABP8RX77_9PSEU